jgi:hypothetical protein
VAVPKGSAEREQERGFAAADWPADPDGERARRVVASQRRRTLSEAARMFHRIVAVPVARIIALLVAWLALAAVGVLMARLVLAAMRVLVA